MSERRRWEPVPVEEAIDRIASCGLLTERQAEAYVYRDIEQVPRPETAKHMGISVNTLDNRLAEARRKIEQAERTLDVVDAIRHRPLPDRCAECGDALAGTFSENDDGEPVCLDCAGIDQADLPADT